MDENAIKPRLEGDRLYIPCGEDSADFNAVYAGFYPACRFTALAAGGGLFYAAGLDESGAPHLFSSLSGGVWEERVLSALTPLGDQVQTRGRILKILYAEAARQIFLVTDAGQVVTLPDCPKCLRIHGLTGTPTDARLDGDALEIDFTDGTRTRLPLNALVQYRVSWSYADALLREGARIIDLRSPEEYAAGHLSHSQNVPFGELEAWLAAWPADAPCLFLCRTGLLADEAADAARAVGKRRAYSMGGLDAFGHIN